MDARETTVLGIVHHLRERICAARGAVRRAGFRRESEVVQVSVGRLRRPGVRFEQCDFVAMDLLSLAGPFYRESDQGGVAVKRPDELLDSLRHLVLQCGLWQMAGRIGLRVIHGATIRADAQNAEPLHKSHPRRGRIWAIRRRV